MALTDKLTAIADAIRAKTGSTEEMTLTEMAEAVAGISAGVTLPNAEETTFGYVKTTETVTEEAPTGKCWYNGVLRPEIPADVLASFPYCWMVSAGNAFIVAAYPWYYASGKMNIATSAENRKYSLSSDGMGWVLANTYTDTGGYTVNAPPTWANHDIPNGSATATAIYFEGSAPIAETEMVTETIVHRNPVERESNYSITDDSLNAIAKRTQEMAGTSKLLTPDEIIYWLGRVKFIPQGRADSTFILPTFESTTAARNPVVVRATANSTFVLPTFESGATGALQEV